ncbi:unnamed protein product [Colias eurytheme]|nr:unnamed protein product [Colias eurytheme]
MLSQPKNRVQAIKSKFESLQSETEVLVIKKNTSHLSKYTDYKQSASKINSEHDNSNKENKDDDISQEESNFVNNSEFLSQDWSIQPNTSYLYSSNDLKISLYDTKVSLSRQSSDPGKKLHRSHAFRCDRSQIISQGPKRHGSCNGRSETSDFSLKKSDKKLSKDRLKQLGNFIEDQMRKENFIASNSISIEEISDKSPDSIPDSEVPRHILDQYAKVDKNKKADKQDSLTDSGVSSETENVDEEKNSKIKKLVSQYEKPEKSDSNLVSMDDLCGSNETMRLERKNPHLILTDTLKRL